MSAPPWTPEKNYYNEESLEVNSCLKIVLLRLTKLSIVESDLFPVVSHIAELLEKRWLSLTAD